MSRLRPGRPLKPFRRPWLWAGLWIAAIATVLVASLSPAPPLPPVDNSDKLGHFFAYAVLAIGAVQLYARRASLLGAGIGLVLLGIAVWAFVWAERRGQFDDLDTPALDILADDEDGRREAKPPAPRDPDAGPGDAG